MWELGKAGPLTGTPEGASMEGCQQQEKGPAGWGPSRLVKGLLSSLGKQNTMLGRHNMEGSGKKILLPFLLVSFSAA